MKRFWIYSATAAFLGLSPAWVSAQDEALFERLDANKDGQVAADEVDEERRRLFERLLRNGDKNSDGKLSKEEFAEAIKARPVEAAPAGGDAANLPNPREVFSRFDRNNDGKLSKEEAPDRLKENFDRIDANKDGQIELDELRQAFAELARRGGAPGTPGAGGRMSPELIERMFKEGDKNGDGKLSKDEVPEARREMFSRVIARMDDDGDGAITKEQFVKALNNCEQPQRVAAKETVSLREAIANRIPPADREPKVAPKAVRPTIRNRPSSLSSRRCSKRSTQTETANYRRKRSKTRPQPSARSTRTAMAKSRATKSCRAARNSELSPTNPDTPDRHPTHPKTDSLCQGKIPKSSAAIPPPASESGA